MVLVVLSMLFCSIFFSSFEMLSRNELQTYHPVYFICVFVCMSPPPHPSLSSLIASLYLSISICLSLSHNHILFFPRQVRSPNHLPNGQESCSNPADKRCGEESIPEETKQQEKTYLHCGVGRVHRHANLA